MRRAMKIISVALSLVVLAGCGSSDSDTPDTTTSPYTVPLPTGAP